MMRRICTATGDLTLEEDNGFFRGLWELACGSDDGECLTLEDERVSKGTNLNGAYSPVSARLFSNRCRPRSRRERVSRQENRDRP